MALDNDTIAAQATPPGYGGVGIVRVSGPLTTRVAQALLDKLPRARLAVYSPFRAADGAVIDYGIALYFPAPHSFTGEDVLELQGHGGPVVLDMLLSRIFSLGVRMARPGEFSERAFLNDKIDLAQAEAVADLIAAASTEAARSALRTLEGDFSSRVNSLRDQLIELRMFVESAIDFPEEEIDFLSDSTISAKLDQIIHALDELTASARQGSLLREGMTLVIAGLPNAGKSSLLNRLSQRDSAIVTDIPGTTRDVLREQVQIEGLPLHIIDTAGLRESSDPVERLGIQKAWQEIRQANRVLLMVDDQAVGEPDADSLLNQLPAELPVSVVHNKIDLTGKAPGLIHEAGRDHVYISALTGAGLDILRRHLLESMGYLANVSGRFMARRRHLDALSQARQLLVDGRDQLALHKAGELLAEDLRQAQQSLGEITGEFSSEDLLGRIFASFCIGK